MAYEKVPGPFGDQLCWAGEAGSGKITYTPPAPSPDFTTVTKFEQAIADFFGAPYAVATDSATSAIELCLRYTNANTIVSPINTYLSVPMLSSKLKIKLFWVNSKWVDFYLLSDSIFGTPDIYDAAVLWCANSYIPGSFMCLSFQHQKHLSLGRGGMILCDDKEAATQLKKMSYDGRLQNIPWREQGDITTQGYHYYLFPELAELGLSKLQAAIDTPPKIWDSSMYPDISKYTCFKT